MKCGIEGKKLLIIGAGGHGKVAVDIALKMNEWEKVYFLDDDKSITSSIGIDVIGRINDAYKYIHEYEFFVAVGNNNVREQILNNLEKLGANIATLVHPQVSIGSMVEIGVGTSLMAGVVINSSSIIGKGCIINTGSTVDHDSVIEDYVHISPGVNLAGEVTVGKGTWLGIGSVVSNNVKITSGCIIGAGALVIMNISQKGTYIGVPVMKIE